MALGARLELRQRQALIITPQLQQAIKLLQLSNLDLQIFIDRELEQNPFLERSDDDSKVPFTEGNALKESAEAPFNAEPPLPERPDLATAINEKLTIAEAFEAPYQELRDDLPGDFSNDWTNTATRNGSSEPTEGAEAGDFLAKPAGLTEHLADQLLLATSDPSMRLIGRYLIDLVDDAGYFRGDLRAIAEQLGASFETVDATLTLMQTFEPAGVCARDLRECLALQLIEKDRLDPLMARLIDHLDLIAAQDFAKLRRITGISAEDLEDALVELKHLNPKPGLRFGSIMVEPVIPDVLVRRRKGKGGGWLVEINQETLPKLLINQSYYTTVCGSARSDGDKSYMSNCLTTANWLIKSLDQRTRTILKVGQEIVKQQEAFLTHGVRYLKPLNLRDVADSIGMHESTVSRVTSNKYMATPRGVFEMKYFFTSAIHSASPGESHSSEAVRHRIKQLIDAETPSDVLSDDQIVSLLLKDGIDIARRTVAKYREALRIPSSVQRRRQKRQAASKVC
jgi:RNA polymerase sigma-54 factor